MGLPIWNYSDGDEQHVDKSAKDAHKEDLTAAARSVIRRRASVHGRRNHAAAASSRNRSSNRNSSNTNTNRNAITGSLGNSSRQHLPPPVPEPAASSRSRHGAQTTIRLRDGTLTIGRDGPRFMGRHVGAEGQHEDGAGDDADFRRAYVASHPEEEARVEESVSTRMGQQQRAHRAGLRPLRAQAFSTRPAATARSNELRHYLPDISASPSAEPSRPQSRTEHPPRTNLPTPPLDTSSLPTPSEILERFNNPSLATPSEILDRSYNSSLPHTGDVVPRSDLAALPTPNEILERNRIPSPNQISFTTRALSPDNGLGDRQRSPSPNGDPWQIMGTTITPDDSLPSTSTSFTTAAAATNASFNRLDDQDISFDDTMREMGIEVSSTPDSAHSSDDNMSSDEEGNNSDSSSDDDNAGDDILDYAAAEAEINSQRSRIGMRLYDLAMSTPEGRQQIEALRRRHHHLPHHRSTTSYLSGPLSQEPAEMTRDAPTLPTPLSHSGQDEGDDTTIPLPTPDRFSTDIHSRADEATSSAQLFFERVAGDEDARARIREARMRTRARIARYRESRDREREAIGGRRRLAMAEMLHSRGHVGDSSGRGGQSRPSSHGLGHVDFVARRGGHSRLREPENIREQGRVDTT